MDFGDACVCAWDMRARLHGTIVITIAITILITIAITIVITIAIATLTIFVSSPRDSVINYSKREAARKLGGNKYSQVSARPPPLPLAMLPSLPRTATPPLSLHRPSY